MALMIVIAILARFEEGTQKLATMENPNAATGSQNDGDSKPRAKAPSNVRTVTTSIGGRRNEKTAAMATPR